MTEYADPDLETVAPMPPAEVAPQTSGDEPPGGDRNRWTVALVCLVVAALIVGFALTTVILNATDKGTQSVSASPGPATPDCALTGTTSPPPASSDPDENVLTTLIVCQKDVPATYTVYLPPDGTNMGAPTLDLCNGRFPSDDKRTARRQVYVGPTNGTSTSFSTEAVLYHAPADGAQALKELRSVVAQCPPTPVVSPVGEHTATTKFSAPPDASWPKTPTVQRQAYAFRTTDATTGETTSSIAVYLRRGRALMGLYFSAPGGAQVPVEGRTTFPKIVALFEARMAGLAPAVVNR